MFLTNAQISKEVGIRIQDTFAGVVDWKSGIFVGWPTNAATWVSTSAAPLWRVQQAEGEGKTRHRPGSSRPGLRFILSVYRRTRISDRAFFEHFGFPAPEKIWWFSSGSLSRGGDSHEEDGTSDACNSGTS